MLKTNSNNKHRVNNILQIEVDIWLNVLAAQNNHICAW